MGYAILATRSSAQITTRIRNLAKNSSAIVMLDHAVKRMIQRRVGKGKFGMLHYKACGLDNVWLANGYTVKKTPYGSGVSVNNADGLHNLLAVDVSKKDGRLTRKEFRFLRTILSLSQKSFADMVGVSEQSVSLWERYGNIPKVHDAVLRTLILDAFDGHGIIKESIERTNLVDRLVNQRRVARTISQRWTTTVRPPSQNELALEPA